MDTCWWLLDAGMTAALTLSVGVCVFCLTAISAAYKKNNERSCSQMLDSLALTLAVPTAYKLATFFWGAGVWLAG